MEYPWKIKFLEEILNYIRVSLDYPDRWKAPWWPRDKKDPRLWMANRKGEVLEIRGNPSEPIDAKEKCMQYKRMSPHAYNNN